MLKNTFKVFCCLITGGLCACQHVSPLSTAAPIDLERFMGDWYVIAAIPTLIERNPYNPIERYSKNADGSIATTFSYNRGSFDGPHKTYHPTGYVMPDTGNAEWRMQFIWPFKAEYLIAYVDADYQQTIIARRSRDYVWLMARHPSLSPQDYQAAVQRIADMGYATEKLVKFPQAPRNQ